MTVICADYCASGFRSGGAGKEERRRRSVLAGAAGAHDCFEAAATEIHAGKPLPPTSLAAVKFNVIGEARPME